MRDASEKEVFETMPVPLAVASLAVPTIISQIVTMVYNLADTFFVGQLGDPLMVRPSFVIGGVAMKVVYNEQQLTDVLGEAFAAVPGQKVMVDKFLAGKEFECDALCDGEDVLIPGIFEHIDPSGIHSGDSIAVFPSFTLTDAQQNEVLKFVTMLSKELGVHGLMNIQFVLRDGQF